jgi:LPXTG-motif cell wall-anchored protein
VTSRRITLATMACGGVLTISGVLGALSFHAAAFAGDPTAEECAVIAAQAVINNRTPQAQLALSGGGTCVFPSTTAPTVLAVTVAPKSALPKTGSNIVPPLALGGATVAIGATMMVINRRRRATT